MKNRILSTSIVLCVFVCLLLALIAPFTFLKPVYNKQRSFEVVEKNIAEKKLSQPELAITTIVKKEKPPEQPLHQEVLPDFSKIYDVKEKKRQFFAFIKPAVLLENDKLLTLRAEIALIVEKLSLEQSLTEQEHTLLRDTAKKYKVRSSYSELYQGNKLLERIDIVPMELVLVQAANESAWGTSRFARIGLNFFGIWCYRKGCGLVPDGRDTGAKHEVAAFRSVEHSVERYLYNINTNNAYATFRLIRAQLRAHDQPLAPEILATGLLAYSQRGADYILELTDMIRHNQAYF